VLPALVGAIGDSLTVAFDADARLGPQPEHSWVVGTAADDGVVSHLERLRALGGHPAVIVAARPGAAIATAATQAATVLDAARALQGGETAYVTVELGANDLCGSSFADVTSVDAFRRAAAAAFELLQDGLPTGSHLLVLSVPDVVRLRALVAAVPAARRLHRQYRVCESVLGQDADPDQLRDRIRHYNSVLSGLCDDLDRSTVDCRHDIPGDPARSLFDATFDLRDLSPLDYFHPSLVGQGRIADATWPLTPWGGG
jgi:lysophospholipase L1-like esterase